MITAFETPGYWFLPSDPSQKIAGTLRYSPTDGLRLALTGHFGAFPVAWGTAVEYPLIHGIVRRGPDFESGRSGAATASPYGAAFTLEQCFRTELSLQGPGIGIENIYANRAYAGDRLLGADDLLFNSVSLQLSGLDSWVSSSGISVERPASDHREWHVGYRAPEPIVLSAEKRNVKVVVGWSQSQSHRSYTLREQVGIKVADFGSASSEVVFQQYAGPLQNFLTLATDRPSSLQRVLLYNNSLKPADSDWASPIDYLASPLHKPGDHEGKELLRDEMLFTYEDIRDCFPSVMDRWFEFIEGFRAFCTAYFGLLYAPEAFLEARFDTLLDSLMLFFQQAGVRDAAVEASFDEATLAFHDHPRGMNLRWLRDAMPTVAEVAFPLNLRTALEKHRAVMEPLVSGDLDAFVDYALLTRRYCRYRDGALLDSVAHGAALYWLIEKLKILVKAMILDQLGIPTELSHRLIRRNRMHSHLASMADSK